MNGCKRTKLSNSFTTLWCFSLILSPFPLLTLAWNNYMFSMFSHCVYMLLYRYAAYEGSILWIEKLYICWNLFLLWAWYRFVTYLFYVFARIRTPDANICYYYFLIWSFWCDHIRRCNFIYSICHQTLPYVECLFKC